MSSGPFRKNYPGPHPLPKAAGHADRVKETAISAVAAAYRELGADQYDTSDAVGWLKQQPASWFVGREHKDVYAAVDDALFSQRN